MYCQQERAAACHTVPNGGKGSIHHWEGSFQRVRARARCHCPGAPQTLHCSGVLNCCFSAHMLPVSTVHLVPENVVWCMFCGAGASGRFQKLVAVVLGGLLFWHVLQLHPSHETLRCTSLKTCMVKTCQLSAGHPRHTGNGSSRAATCSCVEVQSSNGSATATAEQLVQRNDYKF